LDASPGASSGGIRRIQFIATPDESDPISPGNLLQKPKVKISGHTELVAHAEFGETCQEMICDGE
jgi:hypothetical protein